LPISPIEIALDRPFPERRKRASGRFSGPPPVENHSYHNRHIVRHATTLNIGGDDVSLSRTKTTRATSGAL
jgi:hypothetical protein